MTTHRIGLGLLVLSSAITATCGASPGDGGSRSDGGGGPADARMRDARIVGDGASGDGGPGTDARVDRMTFCMGTGPAVIVGDESMGTATCAGAIASRVFANSVCTCTDANVVGYLRTRSFDSGIGTMETDRGAAVGVDGQYTTGGYADVGGTFVVAGSSGVRFAGYLQVGGDARFAGDVNAAGYIRVARDLWAAGNVTNIGLLEVGRDLHQPPGHTLLTFPDVSGSTIHDEFTVEPPCDCAPEHLVDIAGFVDDGRVHNDNADVGLSPDALAGVVGLDVDITLPCGRFYLTSVGGLGSITVHVTGRTALFVEGDVNALGVFDIDLAPTAEIDIFIKGHLLSIGAGSYGDRDRPARTRIYVAGDGDVTLVGASGFVGNVYAPNARITAIGATSVYGSLFGRVVDMPGYLDVHYDRAIVEVDRDCPPPAGGCSMCGGAKCPDHRACIAGECAACSSDADCCAPLVCYPDGSCGPLVI